MKVWLRFSSGAGLDCPSDEAAKDFVRMSHGFVALDPVLSSPSGNYHFAVLNEDRQSIFTMPISQRVSFPSASLGLSLLP